MIVRIGCIALVLVLCGCQHTFKASPVGAAAPAPAASPAWSALVDEFVETTFAFHPNRAVRAGRHEFDGRIQDLSRAAIAREAKWLHDMKDRAAAVDPATLDEAQRFEREYLIAQVDASLFYLEVLDQPSRNPGYYGGAMDPSVYLERDYAPLETRMRAYVKYLGAIPAATRHVRENLRTPMAKTFVHLGRQVYGGLWAFYEKDVPAIFASVKDPQLHAQFDAANGPAIGAMKDLDAWFKSLEPTADESFAIGAEKFQAMLRATERVDIPLAELKAMGERDLERNLAALREACARFAPGQTLQACTDKMQSKKPREGPVAAAKMQLGELRRFIVEHRVVTIPSQELATVDEAPRYRRWNAAYISNPGPYEKNLPSIYFIAPPDPSWTPAEQEAYIPSVDDLLFISVHEVWPGHFLQHLHALKAPSKIGKLFGTYAFGEGWAHYTEEMMWEMGLGNGNPEVHVGQLLNALLRDVRYLSAIGLHTGGMSVAESEKMFREKAFQDTGNARQQAARGTFDPGYGNYTLGKLMIRQLRDDWTATRGGRAAWQAFHDKLLSYGSPPLPLVRKAMMGN